MTDLRPLPPEAARPLVRALRLTRLGMAAERAARAFWPLAALVLTVLACLMFGLQDVLPLEAFWAGSVLAVLGGLAALALGLRRFRWPSLAAAMGRLDATLPGRPIQAITDTQAVGAGDAASEAVWRTHVARMADRLRAARAVEPDLKLASRDPFALRYVAVVAFVMALIFGSFWRVASVADLGPGGGAAPVATAAWEGWIEPPAYTGKPTLYLPEVPAGPLSVPKGSTVTLRFYGDVGKLIVDETVSGRLAGIDAAADPVQHFQVTQDGKLAVDGPGGREWRVHVLADAPPKIAPTTEATRTVRGEMKQDFTASDDYGVVGAKAVIALDLDRIDRRYGLSIAPEPRDPILIDLPLPLTANRRDFTQTITEDFSQHPWANLPVTITLTAQDAAQQEGKSDPAQIILPGRRFFDVMALALVENRRDLLWNRANAPRVAQVLRAVSWHPDEAIRQPGVYLKLRTAIRRLETASAQGPLDDALRDEVADVLWSLALEIEDGSLADALERLRQAQERLAEAIRNGATKEEIAKLMDELRQATDDYIAKLAEQAPDGTDQPNAGQQPNITGDQIAEMMRQLQQLMEEGRTAEAQALLEQLNQLMENLQVTRGPGQGGPGKQAMDDLSDTLRKQQELSDDTFGDLNNKPGQRPPGQQQGQNQGQNQGQDQGQSPGQQPGANGQDQPQGNQPGSGNRRGQHPGSSGQGQDRTGPQGQGGADAGTPDGRSPGESLADRQDALRELLDQQGRTMPGAGTPEGDAARDALDRAGRAMDGAEEALRNGDLSGALDRQADAMEALRDGMRNLGEMMAGQQQPGEGGTERRLGQNDQPGGQLDPLGRDQGANGRMATDGNLLQGKDVYRRAQELLEELRKRSADQNRPEVEKNYLRRLLDRF